MRTDDMVRLGVACAELVVRGEDYRQSLADGMLRILDVDAGVGIARWEMYDDEITAESSVTVVGGRPLTDAEAAASFGVVRDHPLLSRPTRTGCAATRVSDTTCLQAFWEQPAWQLIHGINEGRYPAMVSLGAHADRIVIVGAQRRLRDFTDDDMEVLDAIREPLTSALAFRAALDRAARTLSGLPVGGAHGALEVQADPSSTANDLPDANARSVAESIAANRLLRAPFGPHTVTVAPLTKRESEVLALVAAGWTNRRVGRVLAITERTVRKHLGTVYEKLGVCGRTSAATWWIGQTTAGPVAGDPDRAIPVRTSTLD